MKLGWISGKLEGSKELTVKSIQSDNDKVKQELRLLDGTSNKITYNKISYKSNYN